MASPALNVLSLENCTWRPGPFNRFYFFASYVTPPKNNRKSKKRCGGCQNEFTVNSIQVAFVREVCTPKFPARKRQYYHPRCIPSWMVTSVRLYSQNESDSYRDGALSENDKLAWKEELRSTSHADSVPRRTKRKRQVSDEEYEPGALSDHAKSKKRFAGACRHAIAGLVAAYKVQYFEENAREDKCIKCPLSKRWLSPEQVHVDHEYPQTFDRLLHDFVNTIKPSSVGFHSFMASTEFVYGHFFDARLSASFFEFHNKNAKLRLVSAKRNLALPKPRILEEGAEESADKVDVDNSANESKLPESPRHS